jgi:tetratricopeptide (TPR) repeat protein
MKTSSALAAIFLVSATGMASAQDVGGSKVVADAMQAQTGGKYIAPSCAAEKGNHFKVKSGATYLKTSIETPVPENKARALASGERVITEAIQQNQQDKSAGAWYFLGRIALHQGDLVGADSALRKAQELAPDCKEQIDNLRRIAWVPLVNGAIDLSKQEKNEEALAAYREANTIYAGMPQSFSGMASIYASANQTDSAIVYMKKTVDASRQDPKLATERNTAAFNLGVLYERTGRHQEAIATLREYLGWSPNDADAKKALAIAFRNAGMADSAAVLDKESGVSTAVPVAANADLKAGIEAYNAKKYAEAATLIDKALAAEPYNRDAIATQANAYLALKDGPKLVKAAQRLVALEPLNVPALELLREGHRLAKQPAQQSKVGEQLLAQPVNLEITEVTINPAEATLTGTATGRETSDPKTGKAITPAPMTLTFELLDGKGTVIATQDVTVPALAAGKTEQITVAGKGEGIIAYRYHKKA